VTCQEKSPKTSFSQSVLTPSASSHSQFQPRTKHLQNSSKCLATMSSHIYSPLEDKSENSSQPSEDSERLLGSESETIYRKPSRKIPLWIPIALIPIISLLLIGFGAWIGSRWFSNINEVCLAHVQHYCKSRSLPK